MSEPLPDGKKKRRSIVKRAKGLKPFPKQGHKGKKAQKGVSLDYDEKKKNINLTLTPTAIAQLGVVALSEGCSRSETIERWLRGQIPPTST